MVQNPLKVAMVALMIGGSVVASGTYAYVEAQNAVGSDVSIQESPAGQNTTSRTETTTTSETAGWSIPDLSRYWWVLPLLLLIPLVMVLSGSTRRQTVETTEVPLAGVRGGRVARQRTVVDEDV